MNTNTLSKHYDILKPRERLPLIVAASERGDVVERERLARSAPKDVYRLPDYHGLADGLLAVSMYHAAELLQCVALYHGLSAAVSESEHVVCGKEYKARQKRWSDLACQMAYLFVVKFDAWNLFSTELKIDAAALFRFLPGQSLIQVSEKLMRTVACTEDKAQRFLDESISKTHSESIAAKVVTTQSELAGLRAALDARVQMWA